MAKRKLDGTNMAGTSKSPNIPINSDDNVIKYCLMSTLQHVAMTKIIITSWKRVDVKSHILKLFDECEGYDNSILDIECVLLPKIKNEILDKLSQIAAPNRIRKVLTKMVDPMLNEVLDWICLIKSIFYAAKDQNVEPTATDYIDALVWTSRGRIDYKETAKIVMSKYDALSDDNKYGIACAHCLEDDIKMIAPKVNITTLNLKSLEKQAMVLFWTATIKGDVTQLDEAVNGYNNRKRTNYSRNECIFVVLVDNCLNPVAVKYMWDKLSIGEKSRRVVDAILDTCDFACFLLSRISKEQEQEFFKRNYFAKDVLLSFFDHWLWGRVFLPLMHKAWGVISQDVYLKILGDIVYKIKRSDHDIEKCNLYKATLKELWHYVPEHLKEYVLSFGSMIDEEELFSLVHI